MALNSGGRTVSSLLPGTAAFEPMINSGTGQPLTLESVHKDVVWHRKTARDLRELDGVAGRTPKPTRSEEHTSGLQPPMRRSYAVFCFRKKTRHTSSLLSTIRIPASTYTQTP